MLAGKDFSFKSDGLLEFGPGIIAPEPDVRRLEDALPVLYAPSVTPSDRPLYYMYRGVCFAQDKEIFDKNDIRYDITVILPGTIEGEYIKTVGHFHPLKPHSSETYPEYYEVLEGEALYLLQKNNRSGDVEEIIAVEAKKGDKVYIPPGYGHVTINPGNTSLVMANLVESNFSSLYGPFRDKRGAAYYYIQGQGAKGEFVKNSHYQNSVALKLMAAPNLLQPTAAVKNKSLYEAFVADPEAFRFLK
ncbi:glucose-6-phosphate isomerase family protein [Thermanaeromonas sp. C210]|uniref:glucose-6-phosphate isomerase family protein n=1 Tax=Thermanaeromonas sp. C210 TaxID=2731925 RepID=UPI00155CE0AE|nr:glucose-6-phosphate isomerase family protein [Thermanaeromonas sp. C210]GFN22628.1 glucose-6-phosphate isomerase [Thermanaeromonas sp. C210]